jgi:hypothetical protein
MIARAPVASAKRSSVFTLGKRATSGPRHHRLRGPHTLGEFRLRQSCPHLRRYQLARQAEFIRHRL